MCRCLTGTEWVSHRQATQEANSGLSTPPLRSYPVRCLPGSRTDPVSHAFPVQIEELVCTNEQRTKQWEGFRGWLERRGKDRYDVIIDGANLGYYKQAACSQDELADLQQVDWAVRKYEEEVRTSVCVCAREMAERERGTKAEPGRIGLNE